jgi:hypothetical protein
LRGYNIRVWSGKIASEKPLELEIHIYIVPFHGSFGEPCGREAMIRRFKADGIASSCNLFLCRTQMSYERLEKP